MALLIIIRGPPGSGKTEVGNALKSRLQLANQTLQLDEIRPDVFDNNISAVLDEEYVVGEMHYGNSHTTKPIWLDKFTEKDFKIISAVLQIRLIHRIVTIFQYVITSIIVSIIIEMMVTSAYSTSLVAVVTGISYMLATAMLGLLAQRFLLWFKSNRNLVVLLYGLSSVMLTINAVFTLYQVFSNTSRWILNKLLNRKFEVKWRRKKTDSS